MRTAVVVYSFTHNNHILAGDILSRTGGTLFNIEEIGKRSKLTIFLDLLFNRTPRIRDYLHISERFDHYVLIAPIWGGCIATPLKSFLVKEKSNIKSYSFITICGGGGAAQNAKIEAELTRLCSIKPRKVAELSLKDLNGGEAKGLLELRIDREQLKFFDDQITQFTQEIVNASTVA